MARLSESAAGGKNMLAFLDSIAFSEIGPVMLGASDDGYNVIAGSKPDMIIPFNNYARHPCFLIDMDGKPGGLETTAAGRYQFLSKYWDAYRKSIPLPDFSPESQDKWAIQLIRECFAVGAIQAGQFEVAITACKSRWASFPGSNSAGEGGKNQPMRSMDTLRAAYLSAGGFVYKV